MNGIQENQKFESVRNVNQHTGIGQNSKRLTQDRVREILKYCPGSGDFMWKKTMPPNGKIGALAGHKRLTGYVTVSINGVRIQAHRLAWLYMEGFLPKGIEVDHIDRNPSNNSWRNLRLISHKCNIRNSKTSKNNTSGVVGVCFCKQTGRWIAQITINGKHKKLGRFKNKKDAAKARWEGEIKYGFPNCNTTSSALEYIKKVSI